MWEYTKFWLAKDIGKALLVFGLLFVTFALIGLANLVEKFGEWRTARRLRRRNRKPGEQ